MCDVGSPRCTLLIWIPALVHVPSDADGTIRLGHANEDATSNKDCSSPLSIISSDADFALYGLSK